MFTTPWGRPASTNSSISLAASSGVSDAGLKTTVLPVTSAGMIFQVGIASGKFQGVIAATTPIGRRTDMAALSGISAGTVWPYCRRPSPAMKYVMSMPSWTSPRASGSTLPISCVISRERSSLRSRISSATLKRISARFGAGTRRQLSKAAFADSTARSASAVVDSAKTPISSPVAGFTSSTRSALSAHAPSMKLP